MARPGEKVWMAGFFSADGSLTINLYRSKEHGVEFIIRKLFEVSEVIKKWPADGQRDLRESLRRLGSQADMMDFIAVAEEYSTRWREPAFVVIQTEPIR